MKEFLISIGLNIGLAVSGFFGSLLLVGKQKNQNLREQVFSVIGGTMSANYLTPVVIDLLGVKVDLGPARLLKPNLRDEVFAHAVAL